MIFYPDVFISLPSVKKMCHQAGFLGTLDI